jgi:uncharacterized NAD(P)/FAD-binding protein YdhS
MTVDREAAAERRRPAVAIVGGGFSGTLLALHLRRRCPPGTQIHLIERAARFGPGLAYATGNPSHLLNALAGRMSAFPDRPSHFVDWLRARHAAGDDLLLPDGPPPTEMSFVPRRTYGAYIRDILNAELQEAGPETGLSLVRGAATGIVPSRDGRFLSVMLDRGPAIDADSAVLAVGNFPPEAPPIADPSFCMTGSIAAIPGRPTR